MLQHVKLISPCKGTVKDILEFHDSEYVDVLFDKIIQVDENFGLAFDSCKFEGFEDYCLWLVGAVLSATSALIDQSVKYAICWDGGRHHAFR